MIFRWMFGLPFAAGVTVMLFLGMQGLISQDVEAGPIKEPPIIDILPKIEPTKPTRTKVIRPKPLDHPEPVIPKTADRQKNPGGNVFEPPKGPGEVGPPQILPGATTPTVRIPPTYPENCRTKGAQGTVIVEFDVTAEGGVVNPRVIASPDSCFDRSIMKTVLRWHYTPKMVDGRPVPQRNVREAFNFQLTD